jgi:nucleotide-binding universal stress UspA family protein
MTHLLAAVDLSDVTQAVIREAEAIAQALSARLTLIHVTEPDPQEYIGFQSVAPSVVEDRARRLADERGALEKYASEIRYRGVGADALLEEGPPAELILRHAERLETSMIVLGSHGHGMLYHALVGSVSAHVIKESRCPVLIVPDPRPSRREND